LFQRFRKLINRLSDNEGSAAHGIVLPDAEGAKSGVCSVDNPLSAEHLGNLFYVLLF